MSGGKSPKRKGSQFERDVVNTAKAGGIDAKRAYASNGEALGHAADVDCLIGEYRVQCKRRKQLPAYLIPSETVDAVVAKADFGETLIVMRYHDFLDLLKDAMRWQESKCDDSAPNAGTNS